MLNKLNGKTLTIIVVVLLGVFIASMFYGPGSGKRTFPDQILILDSASVSSITVRPKAEQHLPFTLRSDGTNWAISRDGKTFAVEDGAVDQVLDQFKLLRPKRLAGKDESNWAKYEVNDSLGTPVTFEMADGTKHHLIVGKFTYDQATRAGTSYVRLPGEDETYAVDGYLVMSVNKPMNAWRNKTVLQGTKDTWLELAFNYPADTGFVLNRAGTTWSLNDAPADSASVVNYINSISQLQSLNFVDDVEPSGAPEFVLRLTPAGIGEMVTIEAFNVGGEHGHLVRSSVNPDSYFSDAQSQLMAKLFKSSLIFGALTEDQL